MEALKARIRELEKQILRGDRYKCLICMVSIPFIWMFSNSLHHTLMEVLCFLSEATTSRISKTSHSTINKWGHGIQGWWLVLDCFPQSQRKPSKEDVSLPPIFLCRKFPPSCAHRLCPNPEAGCSTVCFNWPKCTVLRTQQIQALQTCGLGGVKFSCK